MAKLIVPIIPNINTQDLETMRLLHTMLRVTDLQQSIDFYTIRGLLAAGMNDQDMVARFLEYDPTGGFTQNGVSYLERAIGKARESVNRHPRRQSSFEVASAAP